MSSSWGENLKLSLFGESHGSAIGAVLDNFPAGIPIDTQEINKMLARRAPGQDDFSTKRKESDNVEILSGVYSGYTTGTPITGIIFNTDTRSHDYDRMPPRPSHADYTGHLRYNGYNDPRGGGHFSARITAPLVFAGAIAKQALSTLNISVMAHISSVYNVQDNPPRNITKNDLQKIYENRFPVFDECAGQKMQKAIEKARMEEDSLGGVVSVHAFGFPAGYGSPMFSGIENKISSIIFGIPAVRGIEFGAGFDATLLKGSQHNDSYRVKDDKVVTNSNNHGGILGGISSGMPIGLRVAFKPTPSISQTQQSVDLSTMTDTSLNIKGRHDPCVVPRAVPCAEAAVALALLDTLLEGGNTNEPFRISPKD